MVSSTFASDSARIEMSQLMTFLTENDEASNVRITFRGLSRNFDGDILDDSGTAQCAFFRSKVVTRASVRLPASLPRASAAVAVIACAVMMWVYLPWTWGCQAA